MEKVPPFDPAFFQQLWLHILKHAFIWQQMVCSKLLKVKKIQFLGVISNIWQVKVTKFSLKWNYKMNENFFWHVMAPYSFWH